MIEGILCSDRWATGIVPTDSSWFRACHRPMWPRDGWWRMKQLLVAVMFVLVGVVAVPGVAVAQQDPDNPVATDFIDPVTGEIDFEAYLAAVAAAEARRGGQTGSQAAAGSSSGLLPRTGSDVGDVVAVGAGLVVLGGAFVASQRRRTSAERAEVR